MMLRGPRGKRGSAGAGGSAGINGYATLGGFVQPAVLATVSNVSYAGPGPGVGSYLDLIVSASVAGRYLVTADTGSRVNLQLVSEGTVTAGNAVATSLALHSGLAGTNGTNGTNAPYWDFANYNVAIVETVTTGRASALLVCAFDTSPNYTHLLTGMTFAFKAASSTTVVCRARINNGASQQSKNQSHTGSGTTQIYTVMFDAPVAIPHDGIGVTVGFYHPNGYNRVTRSGDTLNIPNTLTTFLAGGPGWGYFDVREVVGDNALGVANTMGTGSMHRITPIITATLV